MHILLKTWFAAMTASSDGFSKTTQTSNTPQNTGKESLHGTNPRVVGYKRNAQSDRIPVVGHEKSELMRSQL